MDLYSDDFSKVWPTPLFTGPGNWSGFLFSASNAVSIAPQSPGPSPSPVSLVVQLPLANYIYVTTLSQKVKLWDQLGVIVGFFPSIFGSVASALLFLRMIYVFSKTCPHCPCCEWLPCCKNCGARPRRSGAELKKIGAGSKRSGTGSKNPLAGSSTGRDKGASVPVDS